MARLTPRFSANRVVREYTERYYLPAAAAYRKRAVRQGAMGAKILAWRRAVMSHWREVRFGAIRIEIREGQHGFTAQVYLGALDPDAVRVEVFAEASAGGEPVRQAMARGQTLEGPGNGYEYTANVPASRSVTDYTPRVVPQHPEAAMPLEGPQILWQR